LGVWTRTAGTLIPRIGFKGIFSSHWIRFRASSEGFINSCVQLKQVFRPKVSISFQIKVSDQDPVFWRSNKKTAIFATMYDPSPSRSFVSRDVHEKNSIDMAIG